MLKKLMMTTALSGLMMGAALAQRRRHRSRSTTPAAANVAASGEPLRAKPPCGDDAVHRPGAGSAQFINSQKPDQWLASKFKGTDVVGPDNEKIGDVSDILFDKTGKIEALRRGRRRLPRHRRQGRRAGSGRVPGRGRRQVEERGRQAEAAP